MHILSMRCHVYDENGSYTWWKWVTCMVRIRDVWLEWETYDSNNWHMIRICRAYVSWYTEKGVDTRIGWERAAYVCGSTWEGVTHMLRMSLVHVSRYNELSKCFRVQWEGDGYTYTGWQRCVGCLIMTGHFPRKSPTISGSFAERDLHLEAFNASSTSCMMRVQHMLRMSLVYVSRYNELSMCVMVRWGGGGYTCVTSVADVRGRRWKWVTYTIRMSWVNVSRYKKKAVSAVIHIDVGSCAFVPVSKYACTAYPTCGVIWKAQNQSSKPKLVGLFLLQRGKRDVRALALNFGKSIWKWHRRWGRLYMHYILVSECTCIGLYTCVYIYLGFLAFQCFVHVSSCVWIFVHVCQSMFQCVNVCSYV